MAANQEPSPATAEKRPHSIQIAFSLAALIITAAAIWIPYHAAQKQAGMLPIVVLSEGSEGSPVVDAEVTLSVPEVNPEHTDTKGQISFRIPREVMGLDGRISIRKDGYRAYNQQILLKPRSDFYPIYMNEMPSALASASPMSSRRNSSAMPAPSGTASSKGDYSPAVSGPGNSISYGSTKAPEKRKLEQ